jgi:hypothetical protein
MADIYMNLLYDDYKALEDQLRDFALRETQHTSVEGFYHKSISFHVAGIRFEFHGPIVKAAESEQPSTESRCRSVNPTRPEEQCTLAAGHPEEHTALLEIGAWE